VDPEDRLASTDIGLVHDDLAVEAASPKERGVEDLRAVGGGHDDDALGGVEAVHLDEELVQRLLALVVTTDEAGRAPAGLPDGVQLVDEDDAGRLLLGLLEEVAHARGPDADEHLDELRAREEKEGDVGLAGHGAREEGLAAAGGTDHEHALRDAPAQSLVLRGVAEEVHHFHQLRLGLVHPRHVVEG